MVLCRGIVVALGLLESVLVLIAPLVPLALLVLDLGLALCNFP